MTTKPTCEHEWDLSYKDCLKCHEPMPTKHPTPDLFKGFLQIQSFHTNIIKVAVEHYTALYESHQRLEAELTRIKKTNTPYADMCLKLEAELAKQTALVVELEQKLLTAENDKLQMTLKHQEHLDELLKTVSGE